MTGSREIKMPKLLCPDCSQKISLDSDAVDNNDEMNCPKCDSLIIILKKGKKIKLKSAELLGAEAPRVIGSVSREV